MQKFRPSQRRLSPSRLLATLEPLEDRRHLSAVCNCPICQAMRRAAAVQTSGETVVPLLQPLNVSAVQAAAPAAQPTQAGKAGGSSAVARTGIAPASVFSPLAALPAAPTDAGADALDFLPVTHAAAFGIDLGDLRQWLGGAADQTAPDARNKAVEIALPSPDGGLQRFDVWKSDVLAPELAARYRDIGTFVGQSVDDPTTTLALDFSDAGGLHASISGTSGDWYIDPYQHLNTDAYVAYNRSDMSLADGRYQFDCHTDAAGADVAGFLARGEAGDDGEPVDGSSPAVTAGIIGTTRRVYGLAISTTGEFTAYYGGTVSAGLAAVTTSVSRLNQIYNRDFAIQMQLVANEDQLIFTNAATDPFTSPTNAGFTNSQNQQAIDSRIGSANYDIGHVYYRPSSSGGNNGLAGGIGTVGQNGIKGQGYTAFTPPAGDPFIVDYVAHEMGHQFGGRHNFNSTGGGSGDSTLYAVELGSGQTIMGYAGLGSFQENVVNNSLAQFGAENYINPSSGGADQIYNYTLNPGSPGFASADRQNTGNTPPTVDVGNTATYLVPVNTPFALTALANDANGDALTYTWEQINGGSAVPLNTVGGIPHVPSATVNYGPIFRVLAPTTNPTRTFPNLNAVLAGRTYDNGEQVPAVARSLKFAAVVRDNNALGGGIAIATQNVATVSGAAFNVNSFNSAASVAGGSTQTVSWTNTNTGAGTSINAANVDILLSTDGGQTFNRTLASNTPNDGSQDVQIPFDLATNSARIKVQPTNNVFFDISNANLTITNTPSTATTPARPALVASSDTGISNSDGITNDSTPTVNISAAGGQFVRLFANGALVGSAVAGGNGVASVTASALADGGYTLTATAAVDSGSAQSPASAGLFVTIDTAAPAVTARSFLFETSQAVTFRLSEGVFNATASSVLVVNQTTGANVPASNLSVATEADALTFTYTGSAGGSAGVLTNGNYAATLNTANVTDAAGNALSAGSPLSFFVLAGDANRDRRVGTDDFLILRQNFGLANGGIFSKGDFNYDGRVGAADFLILRRAFGTSLPAPAGRGGPFGDDLI